MKRREIKSTSLLLMVLLALIVTACGKNTDITTTTVIEKPKTESGDEMKGYDFSTFENVEIGSFTADDSDGTSGVGRLGTVLERLGTVLGRFWDAQNRPQSSHEFTDSEEYYLETKERTGE